METPNLNMDTDFHPSYSHSQSNSKKEIKCNSPSLRSSPQHSEENNEKNEKPNSKLLCQISCFGWPRSNRTIRFAVPDSAIVQPIQKFGAKHYYTAEVTKILMDWLTEHTHYPYPTEIDRISLCEKTGLTRKQLRVWLINSRKVSPS